MENWVSIHTIRHFLMDDPLLDWLQLYGQEKGFEIDEVKPIFVQFLLQKKNKFKLELLEKFQQKKVALKSQFKIDIHLDMRQRISQTIDAMKVGYHAIIHGGVFCSLDKKNGWYGDTSTEKKPKITKKKENKPKISKKNNTVEQLKEIKKMLDEGLITEAEFKKLKEEILN